MGSFMVNTAQNGVIPKSRSHMAVGAVRNQKERKYVPIKPPVSTV